VRSLFWGLLASLALASGGCGAVQPRSVNGWSASQVPPEVASDYRVFAFKCSKCHSIVRPLQSGIGDDDFWFAYVERMRRMPSSGITVEDEEVILRFLKYYASEQRRSRTKPNDAFSSPAAATDPQFRASTADSGAN
jgi:hypothetical protein